MAPAHHEEGAQFINEGNKSEIFGGEHVFDLEPLGGCIERGGFIAGIVALSQLLGQAFEPELQGFRGCDGRVRVIGVFSVERC